MENASLLFSGVHFNEKKFADDFSRFQRKKESNDDVVNDLILVESEKSEARERTFPVQKKKRKRNTAVGESVEGFSVFKHSKSAVTPVMIEQKQQDEYAPSKEKKKFYRQLELDALFRKKYNIHIFGNNVPTHFRILKN